MKLVKIILAVGVSLAAALTSFAQNSVITYQGRVTSNSTNFTGNGQFKFAIVTSTNNNHTATATATTSGGFVTILNPVAGGNGYVSAPAVTISGGGGSGATATANLTGGAVTSYTINANGSGYSSPPTVTVAAPPQNLNYTTYWSNDGTSSAGSQPTTAVSAAVTNGLFLVALGDATVANMAVIPASLFLQPNLQLRIWFNDAVNGFAALSPLQNLTPAPYAAFANTASNLLGTVAAAQLVGTLPVTQLSGTLALSQLPTTVVTNNAVGLNLSGTFIGNGAGVTNINLTSVGPTGLLGQAFGLGLIGSLNQAGGYGITFASADVNGDGSMDLVIPNYGTTGNTMTVMTNNGSGVLSSNVTLRVGNSPYFVAIADLNGDTKPDLVCVNNYNNNAAGNSLTIYTNAGGGIFTSNLTFNVGSVPTMVVVADVNNDAKVDLVTVNQLGSVFIWTNNGSGVFGSNATINTGASGSSVAVVDVNNDNRPDLVLPSSSAGTVVIYTNNGSGIFGSNSAPAAGSNPVGLATADVNGDGRVDIITASINTGVVTVLTNNGSGVFGSNATVNIGYPVYNIVASDLNGDGRPDLVVEAYNNNFLTVLTNNSSGKFGVHTTLTLGGNVNYAAITDINGDGRLDILANVFPIVGTPSIAEILNLSKAIAVGSVGVQAANFFGSGLGLTNLDASRIASGTLADAQLSANVALLNGFNYFYGTNIFNNAQNQFLGAYFNGSNFVGGNFSGVSFNGGTFNGGTFNGDASGLTNLQFASVGATGTLAQASGFALVSTLPLANAPYFVATGDLNGDGRQDLITLNSGDTVTVFNNNGGGKFTFTGNYTAGANLVSVAAADTTGSGKENLIVATGFNSLTILTNNGSGIFGSNTTVVVGSNPKSVLAADMNGDGSVDLITPCFGSGFSIFTNNGSGVFGSNALLTAVGGATCVVAMDVNNDTKMDLIGSTYNSGTLTVFTNNGGNIFGSNATLAVPYVQFLAKADVNGDGKQDLIAVQSGGGIFGYHQTSVFTNTGAGKFALASTIIGATPTTVAAIDLNGVGKMDLIFSSSSGLSTYTNGGNATFGFSSVITPNNGGFNYMTPADMDGDGRPDLITANGDNSLTVFENMTRGLNVGGGGVVAENFVGNGGGLTGLNASQITSGIFTGNGSGLTSLNAANLTGSVPSSSLTSVPAASLTGTLPIGVLPSIVETNGSSLKIGSSGTTFTVVQAGQNIMPGSSTVETNLVITFPQAFSSAPKIVVSVANDPGFPNVNDIFAASVANISTTTFRVNVIRLDTAGGWSQQLRINWQAWQ